MKKETITDVFLMMLTDPHFAEFVEKNKNKTTEEIAMEYDIKIDLVKNDYV